MTFKLYTVEYVKRGIVRTRTSVEKHVINSLLESDEVLVLTVKLQIK